MVLQDLWLVIYSGISIIGFYFLAQRFFSLRPYVEALDLDQAEGRIKNKVAVLLDVRTIREWDSGVINDSILMSHNQLDVPDTDEPIICICNSGIRAQKAAEDLKRMGVAKVSFLAGTYQNLALRLGS
jgi:rhodanese-related sulfurtransferase